MLEPTCTDESVVVLVSSGVDSTICAHLFPNARKLFINYGHNEAASELAACRRLFPDLEVMNVEGKFTSPDGVFVPARNLMFASMAVHYGSRVILGAMADDRAPDKTPLALQQMGDLLTVCSKRRITVESPLIRMMKHEAVAFYLRKGGDPQRMLDTWSCYGNGATRCGTCKACFRWMCAMRPNGLDGGVPAREVTADYLSRLHVYEPGRRWAILNTINTPTSNVVEVDIDGTITRETEGFTLDAYRARTPMPGAIERLRQLHAMGSWIVLNSARSELDRDVTMEWLDRHRVPFHALLLEKLPAATRYDDISYASLT